MFGKIIIRITIKLHFSFQDKMEGIKCVRFNENVRINRMYVWKYAYRECRKNYWMTKAVDRFRFERRIRDAESLLNSILIKQYEKFKKSMYGNLS